MFQHYDKKSCQFECRLKNSILAAECVPWDYPVPQDDAEHKWSAFARCVSNTTHNHTNTLSIFEASMGSTESVASCHCLPNCEHVHYEAYYVSS